MRSVCGGGKVAIALVVALTMFCLLPVGLPLNALASNPTSTRNVFRAVNEKAAVDKKDDDPFNQIPQHYDKSDDFPHDTPAQPTACPTVQHNASLSGGEVRFSWVLQPTADDTCTLTITSAGDVPPEHLDSSIPYTNREWRDPLYINAITNIVITDGSTGEDPLPKSVVIPLKGLFSKLPFVTSIKGLGNLNSSTETNMRSMFEHDPQLRDINLSGFNSSNATNMDYMFHNDRSLQSLNLRQLDTSRVTTMRYTFAATALTDFSFADIDTSSVTNMRKMLHNEPYMTNITMAGSTTGNVTDMGYIFEFDVALTSVDTTGFRTGSVSTMGGMFAGDTRLERVNLSGMDTSGATTMRLMFCMCSSLGTVDVSGFDTSHVTDMHSMFEEMSKLTSIVFGAGFDTSNVTTFDTMFQEDFLLTSSGLDVSGFNTSSATDMRWMFAQDSSLSELDLSGFDTAQVTRMTGMFRQDSNLASVRFGLRWNTAKVTAMDDMFSGCSSLTSLDVSGFNTSNVTSMHTTFADCSSLVSLDLSHFDTSAVTTFSQMFDNDSSLKTLKLGSGWHTSQAVTMYNMFHNLYSLGELDVSGFDTSSVTDMKYMFGGCHQLSTLAVSHFDTSKVTDMTGMFKDCSRLVSLGPAPKQTTLPWNTANIVSMTDMFNSASALTSLDLSSFDTRKVSGTNDMHAVFASQRSLTKLTLGDGFDMRQITDASGMFYDDANLATLTLGKNTYVPAAAGAGTMFNGLGGTWAEISPNHGNEAWSGGWSDVFGLSPSQATVSGAAGNGNLAPRSAPTTYVRGATTITFKVNNPAIGSGSDTSALVLPGHTIALDYAGDVIKGQKVTSWSTKPDGTGVSYQLNSQYDAPATPGSKNLVLYAQWWAEGARLPLTGGSPWWVLVCIVCVIVAALANAGLSRCRRIFHR